MMLANFKKEFPEYAEYPDDKVLEAIKKRHPAYAEYENEKLAEALEKRYAPEEVRGGPIGSAMQALSRGVATGARAVTKTGTQLGRGLAAFGAGLPGVAGGLMHELGESASSEPAPLLPPGFSTGRPWLDTAILAINPITNPITTLRYIKRKAVIPLSKKTDLDERLAATGRDLAARNAKMVERLFPRGEGYGYDQIVFDIGSGFGSLGLAVGLSMATGNTYAAAAAFGLMQKSRTYTKARERGLSPAHASNISTVTGMAEAALEKIGLDFFLKKFKTPLMGFIGRAAEEAIQEFSQSASSAGIEHLAGIEPTTIGNILKDAAYEGFIGAIVGGGSSIAMDTARGMAIKEADKVIRAAADEGVSGALAGQNIDTALEKARVKLERLGIPASEVDRVLGDLKGKLEEFVTLLSGEVENINPFEAMEPGWLDEKTAGKMVSEMFKLMSEEDRKDYLDWWENAAGAIDEAMQKYGRAELEDVGKELEGMEREREAGEYADWWQGAADVFEQEERDVVLPELKKAGRTAKEIEWAKTEREDQLAREAASEELKEAGQIAKEIEGAKTERTGLLERLADVIDKAKGDKDRDALAEFVGTLRKAKAELEAQEKAQEEKRKPSEELSEEVWETMKQLKLAYLGRNRKGKHVFQPSDINKPFTVDDEDMNWRGIRVEYRDHLRANGRTKMARQVRITKPRPKKPWSERKPTRFRTPPGRMAEVEFHEKFNPKNVPAASLDEGDTFTIQGDEFIVTKKEPGNIKIEDGYTINADEFDMIPIDHGKVRPPGKEGETGQEKPGPAREGPETTPPTPSAPAAETGQGEVQTEATPRSEKPDVTPAHGKVQAKPEAGAAPEAEVDKKTKRLEVLADNIADRIETGEPIKNNPALEKMAAEVFDGALLASGKYSIQDLYNALEAGFNKYLRKNATQILGMRPVKGVDYLQRIIKTLLPTQVARSIDKEKLQQFSTPPSISLLATILLDPLVDDIVLEPSAGTGSLLPFVHAKKIYANEIDPKRTAILRFLGYETTSVDAEILDDVLPDNIRPTAIIMNPPFSAIGTRDASMRSTKFGFRHVESALRRLADGGRLVAILGESAYPDRIESRKWLEKLEETYQLIGIYKLPGSAYGKYGTTFGTTILVIDKSGPTRGFGLAKVYDSLGDLANDIENAHLPYSGRIPKRAILRTQEEVEPADRRAADRTGRERQLDPGGSEQHDAGEHIRSDKGPAEPGTKRPGPDKDIDRGSREGEPGPAATEETEPDRAGTSPTPSRGDIQRQQPGVELEEDVEARRLRKEDEAGRFVDYVPSKLKGGAKHPGHVVESSSMAGIVTPDITYTPKLPNLIKGSLSALQLEGVSLMGQSHSKIMPDGRRAGFFLGDGTGIGKGRQLAAFIWDNWNHGRRRSVWISFSSDLKQAAARDFEGIGAAEEIPLGHLNDRKVAPTKGPIKMDDGCIFLTYNTLIMPGRLEQITEWLGEDGVIVLDECHKAKNAYTPEESMRNASKTGITVLKLQDEVLPKAYVVYSSATGATDVYNMGYMSRLGLWGEGTAFNSFGSFMEEISRGGLGAMEMIARDTKAMGKYLSRNLSYKGVEYKESKALITKHQKAVYDRAAEVWRVITNNIEMAIDITNAKGTQRARFARSLMRSAHQRFVRQMLMSFKVPTIIKLAEQDIADGKAVVIGLLGTGEAAVNRAAQKRLAEDEDLEGLDLTPRQSMIQYIENSFPTEVFQEKRDSSGNVIRTMVMGPDGKPVHSREAQKLKQRMLDHISDIDLPDNPLDQLINYFYDKSIKTGDKRWEVAELTGRSKVLRRNPSTGKMELVKRVKGVSADKASLVEMERFQNGEKLIAVISQKASTGIDLHSDLAKENQRKRSFLTLELSWSADIQMQIFGRVHRSNQAEAPEYTILTTDIGGEGRFSSAIAKRLASLGAITKGQRGTAGGDVLDKYNYESDYGSSALQAMYDSILNGFNDIPGISNAMDVLRDMGVLKQDKDGALTVSKADKTNVNRFLNRVLCLEVDRQNAFFNYFHGMFEGIIENAKEKGMFDEGITDLKGEAVRFKNKSVLRTDETTGAVTEHIELEVDVKTNPITVETFKSMTTKGSQFKLVQNAQSGHYAAIMEAGTKTDPNSGRVLQKFLLYRYTGAKEVITEDQLSGADSKRMGWKLSMDVEKARAWWAEQVGKVPDVKTEEAHLISGLILPYWSNIKRRVGDAPMKVVRAVTDDGNRYVGLRIPPSKVNSILSALGVTRKLKTPQQVYDAIMDEHMEVELVGGLRLTKSSYRRQYVIQVRGVFSSMKGMMQDMGVIVEKESGLTKYIIPTDKDAGIKAIEALLKKYPIVSEEGSGKTKDIEPYEGLQSGRSGRIKDSDIRYFVESRGIEGARRDEAIQSLREQLDAFEDIAKKEKTITRDKAKAVAKANKEAFDPHAVPNNLGLYEMMVLGGAEMTASATQRAFKDKDIISRIVIDYMKKDVPDMTPLIGKVVKGPADLAALLIPLRSPFFESAKVMYFDKDDRIIGAYVHSLGAIHSSIIYPTEMISNMPEGTAGVVIAHNHPSGRVTPSPEDIKVTKAIKGLFEKVGVKFIDHIITDGDEFYTHATQEVIAYDKGHYYHPAELVKTKSVKKILGPESWKNTIDVMRQAFPGHGHIVYLSAGNAIAAIEKIRITGEYQKVKRAIIKTILTKVSRLSAVSTLIDVPGFTDDQVADLVGALNEEDRSLCLDAANSNYRSFQAENPKIFVRAFLAPQNIMPEGRPGYMLREKGPDIPRGMMPSQALIDAHSDKTEGGPLSMNELAGGFRSIFKDITFRAKMQDRWRRGYQGLYFHKQNLVKGRNIADPASDFHEVAHWFQEKMFGEIKDLEFRFIEDGGAPDMLDELKQLDYEPQKSRISEGFAEFVRLWLTHAGVEAYAPRFAAHFENNILPKYDKENLFWRAKDLIGRFIEQDALTYTRAQLGFHKPKTVSERLKVAKQEISEAKPGEIIESLAYNWQRVKDKFVDDAASMEYLLKKLLGRKYLELMGKDNPVTVFRAMKMKAGAMAEEIMRSGVYDLRTGEPIDGGHGIIETLRQAKANDVNIQDLIAYTYARHSRSWWEHPHIKELRKTAEDEKAPAEARAEAKKQIKEFVPKNPGISMTQATAVVERLQSEEFDRYADQIVDYFDRLLQLVAREGGISYEMIDELRWKYPFYVPLLREVANDAVTRSLAARGLASQPSPIKRAKGSDLSLQYYMESFLKHTERMMLWAAKARVMNAFTSLANIDGMAPLIRKTGPPVLPKKISLNEIMHILNDMGLPLEKDAQKKFMEDKEDMLLTFWFPEIKVKAGRPIVSVWEGGKRQFYEMDRRLYNFIQNVEAAPLVGLAKALAPFNRLVRLGATGLNPSFILVRNFTRDSLEALVMSESGKAHPFRGFRGLLAELYRDTEAVPKLLQKLGIDPEMANMYLRSGTVVSTMAGFDRVKLNKAAKLLESEVKGNTITFGLSHPIEGLRLLFSALENTNRIAEFEAVYKKILNQTNDKEEAFIRAARAAQDVTTDFARAGTVGRQLNQIIPFYNANVQGFNKFLRAFFGKEITGYNEGAAEYSRKTSTVRWAKAVGFLAGMSMLTYFLRRPDEWDKLDDWERHNYFNFWIGDYHVRIVTPFVMGALFHGSVQTLLQEAIGDNEAAKEYFKYLWDQHFSELLPLPTNFPVVGPIIEIAANRSWSGRPIEPKYARETQQPHTISSPWTTELSKWTVSLWPLRHSGLSPAQLEYFVNQTTGSLYRRTVGAADRILKNILGKNVKRGATGPWDIPILGDYFARPSALNNRHTARFFSWYTDVNQRRYSDNLHPYQNIILRTYREILKIRRSKLSDERKDEKIAELIKKTVKHIEQKRPDALVPGSGMKRRPSVGF